MLVFKGTLANRINKSGFQYPEELSIAGRPEFSKNGIHAATDPYVVFLYGKWEELWLVDLNIVDRRHNVVLGDKIRFLKKLDFNDCLELTKDKPLFAYYWVVNFQEILSEHEVHRIMSYILESEESVISWAENVGMFIEELKSHIHTPRYAYLWKTEGFPMTPQMEKLAEEYAKMSKGKWAAKSHLHRT